MPVNAAIHLDEVILIDYTGTSDQLIWGQHLEFGDIIVVRLRGPLSDVEREAHMNQGGPWGWEGYTTEWIESIARDISWFYDDRILFNASDRNRYLGNRNPKMLNHSQPAISRRTSRA